MVKTTGKLLTNEAMAKYTTWRVGGIAEKMYLPQDREDLIHFLQTIPNQTEIFWLGMGSNLLVRDGGISGIVINTRNRLKTIHKTKTNEIYVEVGVPCARIARFCADNGLKGAEFLAGIPGTLGGALKMNAGAFGGETWEIVESVDVINRYGEVLAKKTEEFSISYRSVCGLKAGFEWFLGAKLRLVEGDTSQSLQRIKELLEKRALTQPTNQPSCGSVFKNPEGDYAARLIEASGLKGYSIGGASVSEKHANFIVNTGRATAANIEALIEYVQTEVKIQQGVDLQTEVCRVGKSL